MASRWCLCVRYIDVGGFGQTWQWGSENRLGWFDSELICESVEFSVKYRYKTR